jgi:hypothetical protein
MFARIKEAIERDKLSADGWVFIVLTLDRHGTFSGEKRWADSDEAYRALSRMHRRFFEKLRRWCKRNGMRPPGREWAGTVEAHRSGWPHVNTMLWSPELAEYVERFGKESPGYSAEFEKHGYHAKVMPPELMKLATATSWGTLSTIERVRSPEQVINYLVKLAGETGQALNEIAKLTQLPYSAPARFRRLRAGKNWLPKRRKNPDITGSILRRRWNRIDGTPEALPVNAIKDSVLGEHIALACYEEERLWKKERENAPAIREACERITRAGFGMVKSEATGEEIAALAAAQREEIGQVLAELGTPIMLTVSLPLHVKPEPVERGATGPPPTGPPELEPVQGVLAFESAKLWE